jgi:hypothetical protein
MDRFLFFLYEPLATSFIRLRRDYTFLKKRLSIPLILMCWVCPWGVLFRVTILVEWFRHFIELAVGQTAVPASFSRENAEGVGMPPSRLGGIIETTRHVGT